MRDENIFFNVIIPTFNRPDKILLAIESVFKQSYQCYKIYAVDDCSTESYSSIDKLVVVGAITYLRMNVNSGVSACRNMAIDYVESGWVVFLDDDDTMQPNYLFVLNKYIRERQLNKCFIWSEVEIIFKNKVVVRKEKDWMLRQCDALEIGTSFGFAIPIEILRGCKFDISFRRGEDTELVVRLLSKGNIPIHIPFVGVRKHETHNERLSFDRRAYIESKVYERIFCMHQEYLFSDSLVFFKFFSIWISVNYENLYFKKGDEVLAMFVRFIKWENTLDAVHLFFKTILKLKLYKYRVFIKSKASAFISSLHS
jgi:glycosyltransferase involved in cell wall biosynthesis